MTKGITDYNDLTQALRLAGLTDQQIKRLIGQQIEQAITPKPITPEQIKDACERSPLDAHLRQRLEQLFMQALT